MNDRQPHTIATGRYVSFVKRGHWEYVHRPNVTGIVGIVAVTDDGRLILVEQYRPPVDANVIELPAGLVGDLPGEEDEPLADGAARELLEETGYRAAHLEELAYGAPSAGITDEMITLFLATGLVREHAGGGDEHERITVHAIPLPQVEDWLADCQRRGAIADLKVYAGLHFARRATSAR